MNRSERRGHASRQRDVASRLGRRAQHTEDAAEALSLSQALFQIGKPRDALPGLRRAVAAHPADHALRGALAYALAATGSLAAAAVEYRAVLAAQPASAPVHTNLAVLLRQLGQADEARSLLERAAELLPEHANTAFTLGELCDQQQRPADAFHHYRRAALLYDRQIGSRPALAQCDDLVKLATARMWTGELAAALADFDRALALRPDHALALARRGLALARMPEALASLRRAAAAEPGYGEARRAVGDLLLEVGDRGGAEVAFRAALRIDPGDTLARYFLAAAGETAGPAAPPLAYVAQLFDDYAASFERHLVGVLAYRVPELLCEAVRRVANPPPAAWHVLDLGCGTGLCGRLVRSHAARLVGVDLSAAMLDQARDTQVYDELIQDDLTAALGRFDAEVDLALSADVFNYLGDLAPPLAAAARAAPRRLAGLHHRGA